VSELNDVCAPLSAPPPRAQQQLASRVGLDSLEGAHGHAITLTHSVNLFYLSFWKLFFVYKLKLFNSMETY
jgi:hypothetical protein